MLKFFDRYIIRELIPPSLIGLLIYTFVLLMNHILQLAEVFITRGITLRAAIELLVFLIPSILAFTVPMSVLMGILGGLSRLSSDSEIVAFKTLGISYKRLLRPVLVYSLALLILTSFLTLYLAPRANFKWVQAFSKSVMESVQFRISPKEFNESIPHTVIFFQGMTKERVWEDVFVYLSDPDKEPIAIVAKKGRLNLYPGMKRAVLRLSDGVVHSYSPSEPEKYGVTSFENLEEEINVESLFSSVSKEKRVREKDIHELIKGVRIVKQDLASLEEESGREDRGYQRKWKEYISHWVEIHKKFAFPFVCLIFGILALPLGASTRKGGRTSGFTISLGIITIYYVLITFGEKTAMDGKLPTWLGMWGPNILLLLAALYLFFRSQKESSLFSLPSFLKREKESVSVNKKKKFSRNLPRLSLRFPNILDRYIIRKYLAIFSLVFLSLIVISVIVTFFERIDNIYEHNKPISLLLEYIRYSLPEFIHYIFPIAALTTALLSLGLLTKFNEITAMKTCGLSLYRIIIPVVLLAAVVSFFSYYLQENVLPYSNKKAEEIWNRINDRPIRSYSYLDRRWVLSKEENRIYHYNYFDQEKSAFSQLSVYDLDPVSWAIQRRVYSEKAFLGEGRLSLENCWLRDFSGGKMIEFEKKENLNIDMQEDRSYFLKEWREPDQMSFGELTKYIRELDERNFDTVRFKVDLNYKISFPFVCLIMTLLGIPFAFSLGKKGTLVGIGLSLAIAIIYWGIIGIFQGLGYVSYLSAFLSAWGPNLIFGLIGLYLLFTLRA